MSVMLHSKKVIPVACTHLNRADPTDDITEWIQKDTPMVFGFLINDTLHRNVFNAQKNLLLYMNVKQHNTHFLF